MAPEVEVSAIIPTWNRRDLVLRAVRSVTVHAWGDQPAASADGPAERVAVLGLLNKRNGVARDITLKPGQAVRAVPGAGAASSGSVTIPAW